MAKRQDALETRFSKDHKPKRPNPYIAEWLVPTDEFS
jgi:hypothetical protein